MSIAKLALLTLAVGLAVLLAIFVWRLSDVPPFIRAVWLSLASTETITQKWSAEGMTSERYRELLISKARIDLIGAALRFAETEPKPTFENVIAVLGPPDELLGRDRVLEQYGNLEWHDKCVRYRLGRIQSAPDEVPKLDQYLMLQVCFKDGQATVAYVSGLQDGEPLANFNDTRVYTLD